VIRLKPDYAWAHNNLGNALGEQGKLAEAIAEFREGIRIKPDDAAAHYNLGRALREQGKLAEAIAEFRTARDNVQRGSELAQLIERALTATDP
jgi:tetratricopeptide (TPR) repeat protein